MPGRGGAGNIERANQKIAADLEANQSDAQRNGAASSALDQVMRQKPAQNTALMGRGGAGNTFSPSQLQATGTYATGAPEPPSPTSPGLRSASGGIPIPDGNGNDAAIGAGIMSGRGGAGNYKEPNATSSAHEDPRLRELVEKDLEKEMPRRPEEAYLGPKERSLGVGGRDRDQQQQQQGNSPLR